MTAMTGHRVGMLSMRVGTSHALQKPVPFYRMEACSHSSYSRTSSGACACAKHPSQGTMQNNETYVKIVKVQLSAETWCSASAALMFYTPQSGDTVVGSTMV